MNRHNGATIKSIVSSGFTIVEVLIVIVIIGMIVVVGSVRFREFSQRQALVNAKRLVLSDLRAAQSDANSGRKPDTCTDTLTGYSFDLINTTTYEVYALCGSPSVLIKRVTMPSGITLTMSIDPVIFRSVSQGTNLTGSQVSTITISNSGINSDTIEIRPSGEIR